jgi:hypothetical protein
MYEIIRDPPLIQVEMLSVISEEKSILTTLVLLNSHRYIIPVIEILLKAVLNQIIRNIRR